MRKFAAVASIIGWGALVLQFCLTLRLAVVNGRGLMGGIVVYFGYFTILTNILAALALSAALLRPNSTVGRFFARPGVNTAIATAMVAVGLGYSLLLRRLWNPRGLQLLADEALHDVMPFLFLIYWWLAVSIDEVRWAHLFKWLLYPVGYFVYTLVRGPFAGHYPYPFSGSRRARLWTRLRQCGGIACVLSGDGRAPAGGQASATGRRCLSEGPAKLADLDGGKMRLAMVAGLATISLIVLPSISSAQTAEARAIAPSQDLLLASARLRSAPAVLTRLDPSARALLPQRSSGNKRQGEILMIVGAAGIVTGLIVDEDIVTIAGAGVGGFGLYLYLQGTR